MTKIKWQINFFKSLGFVFISLLIFFGCDTVETSNNTTVSLSFYTGSSLQKVNASALELTEVKFLLSDIKLEMKDSTDSEDDDSEFYTLIPGPFVVNLNLDGMLTDYIVSDVSPGLYEEVKFNIHKVDASETPPDPEFKDGDADSLRYSVIVKGNYNSGSFVYKSKNSVCQKIEFEPPIQVIENNGLNLTFKVDPYSWFYKNDNFLDPSDPVNETYIDNKIKESFKEAYEDDDHDGEDDDGGDYDD